MTIRTEKCRPRCSEVKKKQTFHFLVRNSFHPKVERKKEKERKRRVRGRKGAIIRRWKKLFFLISYSKVKTEKAEKARDKRMFGPFFKKKMTNFFWLLIFFLSLLRKKIDDGVEPINFRFVLKSLSSSFSLLWFQRKPFAVSRSVRKVASVRLS